MNMFDEVLSQAMQDFMDHGFDSEERLNFWRERLKEASQGTLDSADVLTEMLRRTYESAFKHALNEAAFAKHHKGIGRFTLERVRPELRAELDRRIMASASLIKLNREQSIAKTLQRFSGWATAIPAGGTEVTGQKRKEAQAVKKSIKSLPFEERRVLIDQGHKLISNINQTIALGGGAIGAVWHSHWRETNYNYRQDHKERDGKFYLVRDSWAQERGFVKVSGAEGYTDEITQPAEEPFCRCRWQWIYALRSVPDGCLTKNGRVELNKVRIAA